LVRYNLWAAKKYFSPFSPFGEKGVITGCFRKHPGYEAPDGLFYTVFHDIVLPQPSKRIPPVLYSSPGVLQSGTTHDDVARVINIYGIISRGGTLYRGGENYLSAEGLIDHTPSILLTRTHIMSSLFFLPLF